MALVKCVECGKEMSDTANACPNCGAPKGQVKATTGNVSGTNLGGWLIGILVIALVGLVVYFVTQDKHHTDQNRYGTEGATPSYEYQVEDESGLYRLQEIRVHVDADDFISNDDGLSGFYAPEIYVRLQHNQDEIELKTYGKAPQDQFDATFSPSVTIAWAKGDTLTVQVWDKDFSDDDQLFTVKIDHLRNGEFVTKSANGSEITLTMSKIK